MTDQERETLEKQAETGELGDDMRELVATITGGEDRWEHGALLQGHLTTMWEEHGEDIQLAFEELIEEEESKGNFIFDEVPVSPDAPTP